MVNQLPSEILRRKTGDPRLRRLVNITSPAAFRRGLNIAKEDFGGFTRRESRAFSLGKAAATLQLGRRNLSDKERRQFEQIQRIRIPKVTK